MTMTDPIADMLTRIRNANTAMHDTVKMPSSKLKESLAGILEREGYIGGLRRHPVDHGPRQRPRDPAQVRRRPDPDHRRARAGCPSPGCASTPRPTGMPRVLGGMGVAVVSTSHGPHDRPRGAPDAGGRGGALLCVVSVASRRPAPAPVAGGALMSRVGRAPIAVPGGVTVTLDGTLVTVAGPQGTLARPLPGAITVRQEDATLSSSAPTTSARTGPCTASPGRSWPTW